MSHLTPGEVSYVTLDPRWNFMSHLTPGEVSYVTHDPRWSVISQVTPGEVLFHRWPGWSDMSQVTQYEVSCVTGYMSRVCVDHRWRVTCCRLEDVTDPELVRRQAKCDRSVCLYGYVRGTHFHNHSHVHIPGCGDFSVRDMSYLPDPCPLPDRENRRTLSEKERLIYSPMSGVGGIVYDKDAVYIELGGSHSHVTTPAQVTLLSLHLHR